MQNDFLKRAFFAILFVTLGFMKADADDLNVILQRSDKQVLVDAKSASANEIASWEKTLQQNGRWPDIDYSDRSRTGWQPLIHLARLEKLARAWRADGNQSLRDAAVSAYVGCPGWQFPQGCLA